MFFTAINGLVYSGGRLLLNRSSEPECNIGLDSVSESCGFSFWAFSILSVILLTTSAVAGGCSALVSLRCCKWLPSNHFLWPLLGTVLGLLDPSVLTIFFGEDVTSKLSKLKISICRAKLLSFLFRKLLSRKVILNIFLSKTVSLGEAFPPDQQMTLGFQQKPLCVNRSFGVQPIRYFPCVVLERTHRANE